MDLSDQLKQLFPDHKAPINKEQPESSGLWMQEAPLLCKYEKRNGKPVTIIEGYNGAAKDIKILSRKIKQQFSVGGSFKNDKIIIQGNHRDAIMGLLSELGFKVKRVGG